MAYTAYPIFPFQHNWSKELLETLEWKTDVLASEVGKEQRIQRRLTPRRYFEASFLIQKTDYQYFEHWMSAYGASMFIMPVWGEVSRTTAPMTANVPSVPVNTVDREYVAGSFIALRGNTSMNWEVQQVTEVFSTIVKFNDTVTVWPQGTLVYPCILARIDGSPTNVKITDTAIELTVKFMSAQSNPSADDWTPDTFDCIPILSFPPDESDELSFEYTRNLSVVDNSLGRPSSYDMTGRQFKKYTYRWSAIGRSDFAELKRALYWLQGRTRAAWVPTFMDDLKLISPTTIGAVNMVVRNVGYARFAMHTRWRDIIMVQLRNGTTIYRRVIAATEADENSEVLGLSDPWFTSFTPDDVLRISYVLFGRLDHDSISLTHPTDSDGVSHCTMEWKELMYEQEPLDYIEFYEPNGDLWVSTRKLWPVPVVGSWGELLVDISGRNQVLIIGGVGGNYDYYLMDSSDLEYIRTIPQPLNRLGFMDNPVYDNEGSVWFEGYQYQAPGVDNIVRLNLDADTIEVYAVNPITMPPEVASIALFVGSMTTYYYYPMVNPYDNSVWVLNASSWGLIHKISKASTSAPPLMTIYLGGSYLHFDSEFAGVEPDISWGNATGPWMYADTLFFVSETEAYMMDYQGQYGNGLYNRLYRVDLVTGHLYYQFTLSEPLQYTGQYVAARPLRYNEATGVLWFHGAYSFWAWEVGTHPSTIVRYPISRNIELMPWGTGGDQFFPNGDVYRVFNPYDNRYWFSRPLRVVQYNWQNQYAGAASDRDINVVDSLNLSSRAIEGSTEADSSLGSAASAFTWAGHDVVYVSSSLAWGIGHQGSDLLKIRKVGPRPVPAIAKYVRLTVYRTVDNAVYSSYGGLPWYHNYPLSIQEIEIRMRRGGSRIPITSITASSSDPAYPVSNLTNGELINPAKAWKVASNAYPITIDMTLCQEASIYEVAIWPQNDRGAYSGLPVSTHLNPHQPGAYAAPYDFQIETSTDGVTWTMRRAYYGVGAWFLGISPGVDPPAPRCFDAF